MASTPRNGEARYHVTDPESIIINPALSFAVIRNKDERRAATRLQEGIRCPSRCLARPPIDSGVLKSAPSSASSENSALRCMCCSIKNEVLRVWCGTGKALTFLNPNAFDCIVIRQLWTQCFLSHHIFAAFLSFPTVLFVFKPSSCSHHLLHHALDEDRQVLGFCWCVGSAFLWFNCLLLLLPLLGGKSRKW